jgi:hypothetical protein
MLCVSCSTSVLYTIAANFSYVQKNDIYVSSVAHMSRKRVLSTVQLQTASDLQTLDVAVRELMQTSSHVPCNALLTAGYAIFKRSCLYQLQDTECSNQAQARVHLLGNGFSLQLHQKQVLLCFTPRLFDLPEKEDKACATKH